MNLGPIADMKNIGEILQAFNTTRARIADVEDSLETAQESHRLARMDLVNWLAENMQMDILVEAMDTKQEREGG